MEMNDPSARIASGAGAAAEAPESARQDRFAQAVEELLVLHALFEGAAGRRERAYLYAQCTPWLSLIKAHKEPALSREVTSLANDVDSGLRSLAWLDVGTAGTAEEHAAWALSGLAALARCAGTDV